MWLNRHSHDNSFAVCCVCNHPSIYIIMSSLADQFPSLFRGGNGAGVTAYTANQMTLNDIQNNALIMGMVGGLVVVILFALLAVFFDCFRGRPGLPGIPIYYSKPLDGKCGDNGSDGDNGCDGSQIYIFAGPPASNLTSLKCSNDGDVYFDRLSAAVWQKISGSWVQMFTFGLPLNILGEHNTFGPWTFNGLVAYAQTLVPTAATIALLPVTTPFIIFTGATVTSVTAIQDGIPGQLLFLHNDSSAAVTVNDVLPAAPVLAANDSTMLFWVAGTGWVEWNP